MNLNIDINSFIVVHRIENMKKYYYEIYVKGKNGFSQFFSTNEKLTSEGFTSGNVYADEETIIRFGLEHGLIMPCDVEYVGYAKDISGDDEKMKFAKTEFIRMTYVKSDGKVVGVVQ